METMRIVIFVFNGMTPLDAIGPYEILSKLPNAKISIVGINEGPVECTGGLRIVADCALEDIAQCDVLLIPGGPGIEQLLDNKQLLQWIVMLHDKTKLTTSVCTGSVLLGATGITKNKKVTTHWNHMSRLEKSGAIPTKARYMNDGKIYTSAGVSAGIDMSLKLAEILTNQTMAQAIQLGIEYDPAPPYDTGNPEKAPADLVERVRSASNRKR